MLRTHDPRVQCEPRRYRNAELVNSASRRRDFQVAAVSIQGVNDWISVGICRRPWGRHRSSSPELVKGADLCAAVYALKYDRAMKARWRTLHRIAGTFCYCYSNVWICQQQMMMYVVPYNWVATVYTICLTTKLPCGYREI